MMSSVDWPTIDPNSVDGEPDASDLFGGDLFGDELLDMYSATEEISNMLPTKDGDNQNRGATTPNAMDYDSLGALRPSNSLNDFTSILENKNTILPSPTQVVPVNVKTEMQVHHHTHPNPSTVASSSTSSAAVVSLNEEPIAMNNSKKRPATTISTSIIGTSSSASSVEPPTKKASPNVKPTNTQNVHRRGVISSVAITSDKNTLDNTAIQSTVKNTPSIAVVPNNTSISTITVNQHPANAVADKTAISAVPAASSTASMVPTIVKSSPSVVVPATTTTSHHHTTPTTSAATIAQVHKGNHIVATANATKVVPTTQQKDAASVAAMSTISSADSIMESSTPKTEESFKGVAQAAVTNLIMSAGSSRKEDGEKGHPKPVDTSTAHVAALTSNNWVAACAASIQGAPAGTPQAAQAAALAAASDPAAAKAARARRATLTADERARQNRDRNREHARNTRLRKKAYVEELKRTLTELVTQRDATELERRHEKQRDLEVREVRYRVMEEFLKLRARGSEQNLLARWIAILEDGFTLTIPKTTYRVMVPNQEQLPPMTRRVSTEDATLNGTTTTVAGSLESSAQVLHGASQCFDDASKVSTFMSSILQGTAVQMSYQCERTRFMMDGVKAVLDWTLKAVPQTQVTDFTAQSIILKGCMRATFSPASNKLACAELLFDTGDVISQVKSIKMQQSMCPIAETDALLDSVLPQVPSKAPLPSSVSVVSTDKDSSDEEAVAIKQEVQTA